MRRAGPLNLEARTNILKGDKSDISDLGGVDKADSSLCAFRCERTDSKSPPNL